MFFRDIPADPGRFLGLRTGLAEWLDKSGVVLFCRGARCWKLNPKENIWTEVRVNDIITSLLYTKNT